MGVNKSFEVKKRKSKKSIILEFDICIHNGAH